MYQKVFFRALLGGIFSIFLVFILVSDCPGSIYFFSPISFSGFTWEKVHTSIAQYPGPNIFSDDPENIWVDSKGLHLRATYRDSAWRSAEVFLNYPLGYGTYTFFVDGNFNTLDSNVVVGIFLYQDDTHEYDIEFSRWGGYANNTLQYSVQPAARSGNNQGYSPKLNGTYSTQQIVWLPQSLHFVSLYGHYQKSPGSDFVMADWNRSLKPNENSPDATLHINLWLYNGQPSEDKTPKEIVISNFTFTPLHS